MEPNSKFGKLASDESIAKTAEALSKNGIDVIIVNNKEEAKKKMFELVPKGAQLMTLTSMTLEALGLSEILNSAEYGSIRNKFSEVDARTQRQLGAAPDWAIGSCHAVTEDGRLIWASATGSQLPAYASGAPQVILVVGTQKIVKNLDDGLKRLYEYSLPLEDIRALKVYKMHSNINKILIINKEFQPNRIHVILVKENLGY